MDQIQKCADRLFALAEEDRLRTVQLLLRGPKNVSTVAERVGLTIAMASHHLGILEREGIVEANRDGKYVNYRLHPDVFTEADCLDLGCCKFRMTGVGQRQSSRWRGLDGGG